jgi:hypothetical protein
MEFESANEGIIAMGGLLASNHNLEPKEENDKS